MKALHLTYAQYDLLLQLQTDNYAASVSVLEKRLGGFKVAEALVDRGLLIPLANGEGYCLTAKGIAISGIIAALNQGGKTPGAIINIIRESFTYD